MDTQLLLKREIFTQNSTIGRLFIGDQFECFVLEDRVRPAKIKHETAIPAGKYQVVLAFSNRFQKVLPRLLNVPNYDGILIHPGNTAADTSGCLLPGRTRNVDFVGDSRTAFNQLFKKLQAANKKGKVWIEIVQPNPV